MMTAVPIRMSGVYKYRLGALLMVVTLSNGLALDICLDSSSGHGNVDLAVLIMEARD
jgi:hypothetical protein